MGDGVRLERLRKRREFLAVASGGRKWVTPGLVLQAAPSSHADTHADTDRGRVGFTASRKVGNAVARNRAKRRLREAARTILAAHGAPGYDYVLIGRRATIDRAYTRLTQDLETALKKLKLYH